VEHLQISPPSSTRLIKLEFSLSNALNREEKENHGFRKTWFTFG